MLYNQFDVYLTNFVKCMLVSICYLKTHFMLIMLHYDLIESKSLKPTISNLRLGSQNTSHKVPNLFSSLSAFGNTFVRTIILWQLPSKVINIFINRTALSLCKMLFSNEHMQGSLWLKMIRLFIVLLEGASLYLCTMHSNYFLLISD